ncbi:uncharacterized protein TNCV_410671 [Trichonephila clavipes]|nr:uncharacterized protein TNCV_410671 [Trichonephila clavipes]
MRGTLTGQRYVDDTLRPHVGPFLNGLPGAIFQQDNARPHTARVSQDFLRHFHSSMAGPLPRFVPCRARVRSAKTADTIVFVENLKGISRVTGPLIAKEFEKAETFLRIVWCESEHESPKIYELSTVTYGTVSAPYLAQRTLTQLWMDEEANFPIAASVLRNNLYMDDVLCGAATDVLSTIAKIFDPVGLMTPVISKAKIFLQRLWRSKLEWNDLLPA